MWKKAVVGASALVIAGSMMVFAQQRGDGAGDDRGPGHMGMHMGMMGRMGGEWRLNADDMKAFADARIAALHAGLALNADQEKSWPPVEQALREFARIRIERATAGRDQQPAGNPIERLQKRADDLTARGTALKHLADAAAPLYQSLDEAQKRRLVILARFMRPHGGHGGHEGHGGLWREHFGGDGQRGEFHHPDFGDDHDMRGPHGLGRMHADDDEDYRGPL
jgi:hypothetical protein